MKPSTRLCKLLVLLCEAHNEKYPKKRKYTKRIPTQVSERRYKKASAALNELRNFDAAAPDTSTPTVKRGPGRPRKIATVQVPGSVGDVPPVKRGPGRPRKNPIAPIPITPEAQAKIDAIKAKIAALSATIPSDRGE